MAQQKSELLDTEQQGGTSEKGCRKIAFLHTTPSTIAMIDTYMKAYLADATPVHIYDGRVRFDNFRSPVGVTPQRNLLRWANFADQLEREGCELIVSCCSLMPQATAFAQAVVSVPFIQLDGVVLDEAVQKYRRIGIVTTTERTVPFVREELQKRAAAISKPLELVFGGDNRAIEYFYAGEIERHDQMVCDSVRRLADLGVDCVLMGQIPLALLEDRLNGMALDLPVLCAGKRAFERLRLLVDRETAVQETTDATEGSGQGERS